MALRDYDYVIPANHDEVDVPNINLFLQNHTYVQRPAIRIQEQKQEDQPQAEEQQPQEEEQQQQQQQDQPQKEEEQQQDQQQDQPKEEDQQQAKTYRTIPGIRLNPKFYVDNFGYKYYKKSYSSIEYFGL